MKCAYPFAAGLHCRYVRLRAALAEPLVVPGLILGLGLLLRVSLIAAGRFHADEALYCGWGLLIATGKDIFLRTQMVDKPPVLFYVLALSFKLFGSGETAARLPNLIASVAGIALLYRIALELFDRRTAALSALFLALSPFDIQFAPTAFTDPLMVTFALASCLLALRGRYRAAGVAAGLAAATKPTALAFVPFTLLLVGIRRAGEGPRQWLPEAGLGLGAGLGAVVAVVAGWDVLLRPASCRFLDVGQAHYGGLHRVAAAALLPRLQSWLAYLGCATGSAPLNALLAAAIPGLMAYGLWRRHTRPGWMLEWVLVAFALGFLAVHTVLSFGLWDRYLLGLVPIVALLLARAVLLPLDALGMMRPPGKGSVAYELLLVALLPVALVGPAGTALRYGYPVGSDHGAYQGIDAVAAYFRGSVPAGSIVFHKWLGWHYSYYLFGLPYNLQYYPTPDYLAEAAARQPLMPKYVVIPSWASRAEFEACLARRGLGLEELHRTYRLDGSVSFTVCRIAPGAIGGAGAPARSPG